VHKTACLPFIPRQSVALPRQKAFASCPASTLGLKDSLTNSVERTMEVARSREPDVTHVFPDPLGLLHSSFVFRRIKSILFRCCFLEGNICAWEGSTRSPRVTTDPHIHSSAPPPPVLELFVVSHCVVSFLLFPRIRNSKGVRSVLVPYSGMHLQ